MEQQFKYFAFISYSSKDTAWGKRLQRKLEHYRMPSTLCSEHGWKRKPINPVFFAPTDIQPGGLTEELQERLRASRNLIVICSPHSAQSEWVGKEIEFFHQLGRTKEIHFFIVDGTPHSGDKETECFNPIVETLGLPEILGANIHEKNYRWPWLNKERAYVQLISKLLGVEFDAIWQRHKRLLIQRMVAWALILLLVIAAMAYVWRQSQPVDVSFKLNEASAHNDLLPQPAEGEITLILDNESKSDTIYSLSEAIIFPNIPHRYINKEVRVRMSCSTLLPLDTTVVLQKDVTLSVYRDPAYYGDVRFTLWRVEPEGFFPNISLEIDGMPVTSDENGLVSLFVPLERQRPAYHVTTNQLQLEDDSIVMPLGENAVVKVQ